MKRVLSTEYNVWEVSGKFQRDRASSPALRCTQYRFWAMELAVLKDSGSSLGASINNAIFRIDPIAEDPPECPWHGQFGSPV
jgi:hypothetical protein